MLMNEANSEELNEKLIDAALNGNLKGVKGLVDAGADANNTKGCEGNTPLMYAVIGVSKYENGQEVLRCDKYKTRERQGMKKITQVLLNI